MTKDILGLIAYYVGAVAVGMVIAHFTSYDLVFASLIVIGTGVQYANILFTGTFKECAVNTYMFLTNGSVWFRTLVLAQYSISYGIFVWLDMKNCQTVMAVTVLIALLYAAYGYTQRKLS